MALSYNQVPNPTETYHAHDLARARQIERKAELDAQVAQKRARKLREREEELALERKELGLPADAAEAHSEMLASLAAPSVAAPPPPRSVLQRSSPRRAAAQPAYVPPMLSYSDAAPRPVAGFNSISASGLFRDSNDEAEAMRRKARQEAYMAELEDQMREVKERRKREVEEEEAFERRFESEAAMYNVLGQREARVDDGAAAPPQFAADGANLGMAEPNSPPRQMNAELDAPYHYGGAAPGSGYAAEPMAPPPRVQRITRPFDELGLTMMQREGLAPPMGGAPAAAIGDGAAQRARSWYATAAAGGPPLVAPPPALPPQYDLRPPGIPSIRGFNEEQQLSRMLDWERERARERERERERERQRDKELHEMTQRAAAEALERTKVLDAKLREEEAERHARAERQLSNEVKAIRDELLAQQRRLTERMEDQINRIRASVSSGLPMPAGAAPIQAPQHEPYSPTRPPVAPSLEKPFSDDAAREAMPPRRRDADGLNRLMDGGDELDKLLMEFLMKGPDMRST